MLTNFEFDAKEKDGVVIIKIKGELDALVAPKLKEKFMKYAEQSKVKFIIDFSELLHINSLAMGILRARLKEVKENSGDIKLINLSSHIATIFEMVGLDEIFNIYPTEEEAMAAF